MAIKFITIKCPACGADQQLENNRDSAYCTYCGAKIIISNGIEPALRKKNRLIRVSVLLVSILFIFILTACDKKEQPVVSAGEIPVEVELLEETEVNEAASTGETPHESEETQPESEDKDVAEEVPPKEDSGSDKAGDLTVKVEDPAAGSTAQTDTQSAALVTPTPTPTTTPLPTQQVATEVAPQNNTSSGSSYEQIFNEYTQKLADYYNTAKGELQSEASSGKSIDELATSCSNKVSRLAEISTEGVNKMADLCVKRGGSASEYMNYGTKLESVYMDYGTKLESVYMSGAMNSQTKAVEDAMKDLGLPDDISGQYGEEVNKAMEQYNDELNKAMDDYNQQMQDMLKEYGF